MSRRKYNKVKANFAKQRVQNTILRGGGGETVQDRSASNTAAQHTLHPYYNNNFLARWQEYVRWYMTSWEAAKLVNIPVQDALREPVELQGLSEDDECRLWDAYENFNVEQQIRRALIQERLLGGCIVLPILLRPEDEETCEQLDYSTLQKGDLQAINVVDVGRISRAEYTTDPFSPSYDCLEHIQIDATIVHTSRLIMLNSDPLFNFASQRIMENYRFNPAGFGESVLSTLYDTLIRVTGTQQGAYHLVNLSSVLLVACAGLRSLEATGSPAKAKLEELAEQVSIYRAGIIDGKDVEIKQHAASFGSVPELVMAFLQILSAGSDIPATRFLGQSPGGLNATGDSDLENYYNHIAAWQRMHLEPLQRKVFGWLGSHIWGNTLWKIKSQDFKLDYPPLWNIDKVQQAQIDNTYSSIVNMAADVGLIDQASALAELKDRKIFQTDVAAGDMLTSEAEKDPFGGGNALGIESPFGESGKQFGTPMGAKKPQPLIAR